MAGDTPPDKKKPPNNNKRTGSPFGNLSRVIISAVKKIISPTRPSSPAAKSPAKASTPPAVKITSPVASKPPSRSTPPAGPRSKIISKPSKVIVAVTTPKSPVKSKLDTPTGKKSSKIASPGAASKPPSRTTTPPADPKSKIISKPSKVVVTTPKSPVKLDTPTGKKSSKITSPGAAASKPPSSKVITATPSGLKSKIISKPSKITATPTSKLTTIKEASKPASKVTVSPGKQKPTPTRPPGPSKPMPKPPSKSKPASKVTPAPPPAKKPAPAADKKPTATSPVKQTPPKPPTKPAPPPPQKNLAEALNLTTDEVNTLLRRGYRLGRQIGKGSYGTVYQCSRGDTPVAIKTVEIDDRRVRSVLFEMICLTRFHHLHVVHAFDFFLVQSKHLLIVMEFLGGGDLAGALKDYEMEEEHVAFYYRQFGSALAYMHNRGIAHRDLKPENILLTPDQAIAKVADFGLALESYDRQTGRAYMFKTWAGTATYMAPEVIANAVKDKAGKGSEQKLYCPFLADIWSMGIITYELLHGWKKYPFKVPSPFSFPDFYKSMQENLFKGGNFLFAPIDRKFSAGAHKFIRRQLAWKAEERPEMDDLLTDGWLKMADKVDTEHLNEYEEE